MSEILFSTAIEKYVKVLERKYRFRNISKLEFISKISILKENILPFFRNYLLKEVSLSELKKYNPFASDIEMEEYSKILKETKIMFN